MEKVEQPAIADHLPMAPRGLPMARARDTGIRRVILTGGEYLGGLAAVRALRDAGYEPWVAVSGTTASYAARSRSAGGVVPVPEPREDAEGFGRALADAAARLGAVAVLPGSDGAHLALASHAELFPDTVALGTCALEIVEQAVDKEWLRHATAPAGLKTPPTVSVTASDVERGAADLRLPAVVKPARSEMLVDQGGLQHFGVRRVESQAELAGALRKLPRGRGLVQAYLDGRIVTVNGVSWGGEVVCAVHQVADRIWPPDCGMVTYAETVPPDRELEEATRRLLGGLRWSGLFNLQFIACDGERYVIDLNPRVYLSLALSWWAGLNLPAIWVSLMLGEPVSAHRYREGVRFRAEINDLRAVLAALRRGELRRALAGLVPRRRTAHALWSVRDPMPVLTELTHVRSGLGRRIRARFDP